MFIRSLETSRPSAGRRGREESNSQKTVPRGAWLGLTFYDMFHILSCFLILPLEFRNHLHVHTKLDEIALKNAEFTIRDNDFFFKQLAISPKSTWELVCTRITLMVSDFRVAKTFGFCFNICDVTYTETIETN